MYASPVLGRKSLKHIVLTRRQIIIPHWAPTCLGVAPDA